MHLSAHVMNMLYDPLWCILVFFDERGIAFLLYAFIYIICFWTYPVTDVIFDNLTCYRCLMRLLVLTWWIYSLYNFQKDDYMCLILL